MLNLIDPKELRPFVFSILEDLAGYLKARIRLQGHQGSGRLIRSVEVRVDVKTGGLEGYILLNDYAKYLESGVPANRIPFRGVTGRGGTSKYIQGLFQHWRRLGLSPGEALRASFATAQVQKREGMPTRASRRFSRDKNSARTGFIGRTVEDREKKIIAEIEEKTLGLLEIRLDGFLQPLEEGAAIVIF